MKKKLYTIPLTEVVAMAGSCNIMKVGSDLPDDPGTNTLPAPRRRTDVF